MSETVLEERNKSPLLEFAYLGKIQEVLTSLKALAMDEKWEYTRSVNVKPLPILFSYLLHTFARIQEEDKICYMEDYACFNTGLVTENQEELFMVFKKFSSGDGFAFKDFKKESDHVLGRFSPSPERASYFNDPAELIFDPRLLLRVNIDHIIEDADNFARFPADIQSLSKHQLINTFQGAIIHAQKRVKRNYKTAIPQYYRGKYIPHGQLQLLLPLCLKDPINADLALAIFKTENSYMGRTCLTLDMAMNNARLIAKPDDEWLKP